VASWRKSDGSLVRHRVEGLGRSSEKIHDAVIAELTRPRSANVGTMRWQQETSNFYAEASAEAFAAASVPTSQSVFRQVSHVCDGDDRERAKAWHAYWQARAARSEQWLQARASEQARLVAKVSQTLAISTIEPLFPDGRTTTWALSIGLSAMLLGCLWRGLYPPRTLGDSSSEVRTLPTDARDSMTAETAAMPFRAAWVQVRQPANVRLRQICGWAIVLFAITTVAVRLAA